MADDRGRRRRVEVGRGWYPLALARAALAGHQDQASTVMNPREAAGIERGHERRRRDRPDARHALQALDVGIRRRHRRETLLRVDELLMTSRITASRGATSDSRRPGAGGQGRGG
jgi:hypothetical protein